MAEEQDNGRKRSRNIFSMAGLLLGTALGGSGALADEKPLRRVELILLESPRPSAMAVGLHVELAPEWSIYWINPGDAGVAPALHWELPPGYKAGPPRFPTPEKFIHGDIVTYGFKNEVVILCEIQPNRRLIPTEAPTIVCRLDWMACRESCTTGTETARLSVAAQTKADLGRSREILSRFSARFPKPLDKTRVSVQDARLIMSGNRRGVQFRLSGKDAGRVTDFYPYPLENFVAFHSRITAAAGKVVIPLEPSRPSAELAGIDGLLILGDESYEISIPVRSAGPSS
jgi:DsbC/DsbD-like thiol-disulfide interchange protein